jgi:hypothetical protein
MGFNSSGTPDCQQPQNARLPCLRVAAMFHSSDGIIYKDRRTVRCTFPVESVIFRATNRGFTCCSGNSTRYKKRLQVHPVGAARRSVGFLPSPRFLLMRTVFKIAFSFLIWPMSIIAQDHPASGQPAPPVQNLTEAQDFAPASNMTTVTTASSPAPMPVRVSVQPAPAFLYIRPRKQPPTVPAGYAPAWTIGAGFSVTSLGLPSSGRTVLSGMNVSVSTDSGKRFGAKLDLGYERAPNVYSSGHPISVLSYLVGPVFYPSNGNSLSTYAHLLFGGARVGGPFPNGNGGLNIGYAHYPAWALGGGAEYRLSPAFGFRVGVDYLHTHFYNSSGAVRGQNDIRIVNSFVYYPGNPIRSRRQPRP